MDGFIDISQYWLIGGTVPTGTLSFLTATICKAIRLPIASPDSLQLRIETPRPMKAGRYALTCETTPEGISATLDGEAGHATLTASTSPVPPRNSCPIPAVRPDDIPDFAGNSPGAAQQYSVRPIPLFNAEKGRADAWVHSLRPDAKSWSALTALDAWAGPQVLDQVDAALHGLPVDMSTPLPHTRVAELTVSPMVRDLDTQWLFRASERRVVGGEDPITHSALALDDGEVVASCTEIGSSTQHVLT